MRFLKLFCGITLLSILLTSFTVGNKSTSDEEPMYYVSVAWETTAFVQGDPVISNVAYADCKYHSTNMVANQLTTYYNAYYKSSRKTSGINRIVSWHFDTKDKAEKKRRDLIASYNQKWEPLLVEKFSVLCD
jgi:hypothetical protein